MLGDKLSAVFDGPYVVVSKSGPESYTIRRSNDHSRPEVRTHSSSIKKYFERPSRLNSNGKPTRNNLSNETIPLVLVSSSSKTCCSSSSSSPTPITMVYRTRGVYTYKDSEATGFFNRGIAKAKVVWIIREYWETQLRMNVAARNTRVSNRFFRQSST